ncbi:hypothetical protein CLAFUW4_06284 [Fulvia fulva]|uniref:Uncharacterized protein n=1 Tax=Passalora fulva TaxID=5499 RepID=A0A9Q8LHU5_PASFU|nr:uncharacterized protein CLAFUR5_06427 [Fulvia fulva]KAK4623645.1 hypothetical protein CLAFUR4_06287 [Fulvia fulva]KAK4624982.1 hypothetical protein CLAFUR0_06291 [Fulvia fulva]UJO17734.1 hypothetical protein CLAFUR5_06427 [Fulvia fulva]WPV14978.1 hypothetical protein CLAFUW4_06284 [Fulvia fulva]WPV29667.1 hypothetical protein CLAFUW7_06281 [Fulvia fulva]
MPSNLLSYSASFNQQSAKKDAQQHQSWDRRFAWDFYDPIMDPFDDNIDSFEVPPSYDSLRRGTTTHKTPSDLALIPADRFFAEPCLPPVLNYFVRVEDIPTPWKLLTGPSMTNATLHHNPDPLRKKRYRVIYPPQYEDVYLHKTTWAANTDSLPRYYVELLGNTRYEPEPIAILGPTDHDDSLTNEAKNVAIAHAPKVLSRVEDSVTQTRRFAVFCEMEYFSWDWDCKTAAAKGDMKALIGKAKKQCCRTVRLVEKLEKYLEYVGKKEEYAKVVRDMGKSILEANIRLARLRL